MNSNKKVTLNRNDFDSIYCSHCKKAIGLIKRGVVGRIELKCPICNNIFYLENIDTSTKLINPIISQISNRKQCRNQVKEQFLGIPTRKEKEKGITKELKTGKVPF
ncbi:hypothetical protein [Abyssisolibacter fermentans]|uniref:hypothetical protein n=1 Tax=Abyssisolibacter fermentans TaxID=1766203 RepID=UPI000834D921|nr:hypothetical protein [Abyssisolibacter fermentans]